MKCSLVVLLAVLIGGATPWSRTSAETTAGPAAGQLDAIPFRSTSALSGGAIIRVVVVLVLALVVAYIAILVLKRVMVDRPGRAVGGALKVVEAKRLSARAVVFLIEADDSAYILADSSNGVVITRHDRRPPERRVDEET